MERERMVQASMDEMAQAFQRAQKTLEETVTAARAIAQMMEGGALLGEAGDEFRNAINSKLVTKVTRLGAKLGEMQRDVIEAANRIHEAEQRAQGRFQ
jgi:uncharacterized protein YukE